MQIIYKAFKDLSPKELEDVFRLRQKVFIIEQECFYEDIDGMDEEAHHLLFYKSEVLSAYLRLFKAGVKYKEASLGRIVVASEFRGTDLGPKLINKGISLCEGGPIRIEAQAALEYYYRQFGFKPEGDIYVVDGIDHLQMVLS